MSDKEWETSRAMKKHMGGALSIASMGSEFWSSRDGGSMLLRYPSPCILQRTACLLNMIQVHNKTWNPECMDSIISMSSPASSRS